MLNRRSLKIFICMMLMFSISALPIVQAAEKVSLFQKIKNKIKEKTTQLKDKNWWKEKSISSSIGFVASKLGGAAGAAIGYLAGAAIGGPLTAGAGAVLGYRIGGALTRVFGKAIGNIVAHAKVREKKKITVQTVKDAIKSINLKKISAEGAGAVIGDLVGGTFGAALGIALLAGTGAWAIPIIGTVSAAYLGGKLGKSIGRGIGKWIGKKVFKKSYDAAASAFTEPESDKLKSENTGKTANNTNTNINSNSPPYKSSNDVASKKQAYESAYKEYVKVTSDKDATQAEINKAVVNYRAAYDSYTALIRSSQQN